MMCAETVAAGSGERVQSVSTGRGEGVAGVRWLRYLPPFDVV